MNVDRRTVLQATGLIAVGGVAAACSSSSGASASSTSAATSSSAAPSGAPSSGGAGVAAVADIPVGGGLIIADPAVVITQPTSGDIKAFSAICTHQGCLVGDVSNNQITCPCHGSIFSATDGAVIQGPAQQPLPPATVTVKDGQVVIS